MSDHQFWLSEAQFDRIQLLLPNKVHGVLRVDDRRVISSLRDTTDARTPSSVSSASPQPSYSGYGS